jgi:NADPH:quinone reductase-like Zn-dependent oxidoreductase
MGNKASTSETMLAVVRESGELRFKDDYPKPPSNQLDPNQVLLKVLAAGINPADYKAPKFIIGPVVGLDVCGVVEAAGSASPFPIGSRVYGTARGTLANYVVCKHTSLGLVPDHLSNEQAAAIPTTYLTSIQALRDHGNMPNEGGRVLIIGASGGCGLAAVQLASRMKASSVVGVCSGKNEQVVMNNGATKVINYKIENFWDETQKYDVVYDCASGSGGVEDYKGHALTVLENQKGVPHGQYVAINGGGVMWFKMFTCGQSKNQHLFLTDANTKDLNIISKMIKEDGMLPVLQQVSIFNSKNVNDGFQLLKSRRAVGKIVFKMGDIDTNNGGGRGEKKSTEQEEVEE